MSTLLSFLIERRTQRFKPYHGTGITTPEEAVAFFNEAGFSLFSYIPDVELPCLDKAVRTGAEVDTWGWKDALPAARQVFYGAVYHPAKAWAPRPGFVALEMLAPLYALAPILQFDGDRSMLRRYFKISPEAILIADTLEREGSLSTGELRASTGLAGKAYATKFTRALAEAQTHFLISKIGVTSVTRANYGYIWNTFERVFPDEARQAEGLNANEAALKIIHQYVRTALAVPLARIAGMLSLDLRVLEPAARQLVDQGALCVVEEEGVLYMALSSLFSQPGCYR